MNVCGENVILATGEENINFTKVITLNESAASVWNAVHGKDFTLNDCVNALCAEYEVSAEEAKKGAESLVAEWKNIGLLEG